MLKNRLKHFRHRLEMNQKEFATFLGVTQAQISLWERNEKQLNLETAWRIKKLLGCLLDDLFEEPSEE